MISAAIYEGEVMHHRFKPQRHRFIYSVASMLFDIDKLEELSSKSLLFSFNRWNLFSFKSSDHGDGSATPLNLQIRALLANNQLDEAGHSIKLLCYPRMFGYTFNPLSVFYCYDANGTLRAMIYEVHNTFNERHSYLIPVSNEDSVIRQQAEKGFYVSPFMPMVAPYQFRMRPPGEKIAVCIHQSDAEGPLLNATFTGKYRPFSDKNLIRILFKYPLMTIKVILGIHWEALRLWIKRVPLQKRVKRSGPSVTLITGTRSESNATY